MKIEKRGIVHIGENRDIVVKNWTVSAEGATGNDCIIHILKDAREILNKEIKRWRVAKGKSGKGEEV